MKQSLWSWAQKIAHIAARSTPDTASGRLQGYCTAPAYARGIELNPDCVIETSFSFDGGEQAAGGFRNEGRPANRHFAANDPTAMGAVSGANEMGVEVPEDRLIVGFHNIWVAKQYYAAAHNSGF